MSLPTLRNRCAKAESVYIAPTLSLGHPIHDILSEFVSIFGDALIDQSGVRIWSKCSLDRLSPETVLMRLDSRFSSYIGQLVALKKHRSQQAKQQLTSAQPNQGLDQVYRHAIYLYERCWPDISSYFRAQIDYSTSSSLLTSDRMKDLSERIVQWNDSSLASGKWPIMRLDALEIYDSKPRVVGSYRKGHFHISAFEKSEPLANFCEIGTFLFQDRIFPRPCHFDSSRFLL